MEQERGKPEAKSERSIWYRLLVMLFSVMAATGMVGVAVFALSILGSFMR